MNGRVVWRNRYPGYEGQQIIRVSDDLPDLRTGFYQLRVIADEYARILKILKN